MLLVVPVATMPYSILSITVAAAAGSLSVWLGVPKCYPAGVLLNQR